MDSIERTSLIVPLSAKNSARAKSLPFFLYYCAFAKAISRAQSLLFYFSPHAFLKSVHPHLTVLLCSLLCLYSSELLAAKVIKADDALHHLPLAQYVDVLALESEQAISAEQVYQQYRHQFSPVNLNDQQSMHEFNGPLWLHFAVLNTSEEDKEVWLSANIAGIQRLSLYRLQRKVDGVVTFVEQADAMLQQENFAPILKVVTLQAGEANHFYLYIERQKSLDLQLQLLRPSAFFSERLTRASRYSISFGLLAMLIIVTGFLAFYRRSEVLAYHSLYCLLVLSFVIASLGIPRGWFGGLSGLYYGFIFSLFYLCSVVLLMQARAYVRQEAIQYLPRLYLLEALIALSLLSVWLIISQDHDSPWLWAPGVIAALFSLHAYYASYINTRNVLSLWIILLRLVTLSVLLTVVYNADTMLALSQLIHLWMVYYVAAECTVMVFLFLMNDQRRQQQQQQQQLQNNSRNAYHKAQTELLSEVSHDLRSPVAGILGMADLLQSSMLTETQQEQLQAIKNSSQTLLNQISAVNDRLQLQQDQQLVQKSAFELALLVEEAVFAYRLQAEQRNIEFVVNIHADLPVIVEGDAARLRQILQPLIANAVTYTSQGEVLINVSCLDKETSCLLFKVSDTGRGLAKQDLQAIQRHNNKPQWRLNENEHKHEEQTGLARVGQLLQQLGSSLQVESKLGEGCRFSFELVLTALDQNMQLDHEQQDYSILRNKRLLIVDDNHSCCDVLKQQAKSWGMLVNTCYDGQEALAMFRAKKNLGEDFDAIIIDYDMPHLSGLEVAERIRDDATVLPQMIMLTGLNVMPSEHLTREVGIQTIITKPASRKLVRMTLSNLFHMQRRQQLALPGDVVERQCRVLIVEDNDVSRRIISKMMELLAVDYKLVADGQLAVDAAQRERFDMILMDCEMPVMNGFDASEAIISWQRRKQQALTPIIALSAHIMGEHKQRAMDSGMQDFLEKPVKLAELESVIQRFVG